MAPTERITFRLDSLAFGGDAVGRDASGLVTFVPGGAPGDLVEVQVVERKRAYARGTLERVIAPGQRVTPPCVHQAVCGGCPWQHVELAAQQAAKQQIVTHALARVLPAGVAVAPLIAAPRDLGYRTRARLGARAGAIGFRARRSHEVVDVATCLALDPALDAALAVARDALRAVLADGDTVAGLLGAAGQVHLDIACASAAKRHALLQAALSLLGRAGVVGVVVRRPGQAPQVFGQPLIDLGEGHRGAADGFQQANSEQNAVLRRLVRDWALAPLLGDHVLPRVLELYAGDGNFTRDLIGGAQVVAVEGARAAAARLLENLRRLGPGTDERWRVRAEPAAEAVQALVAAGERFDVVVLDPPRAGAAEAVEPLAALRPARMVYVSCDPMTLARDLARLALRGYRTVRVQPVDMMPHTSHIEVVALLEPVAL